MAKTLEQAKSEARMLILRSLPGSRRQVQAHVRRAERIAEDIYRRWQVGPYAWKAKHLRSYLDRCSVRMSQATQYDYWLTVKKLIGALGKEQWVALLLGAWTSKRATETIS